MIFSNLLRLRFKEIGQVHIGIFDVLIFDFLFISFDDISLYSLLDGLNLNNAFVVNAKQLLFDLVQHEEGNNYNFR